jgi:hypothetical protein
MKEIKVGSGVRYPSDPDLAMGEVVDVLPSGLVRVLWIWDWPPYRSSGNKGYVAHNRWITHEAPEKLVVVSTPDHDYWPWQWDNASAEFWLWLREERYYDYLARETQGEHVCLRRPKNPWKE